jgi:transposase-like protein
MSKGKRSALELRERAVRMVFELEKDLDSEWGAICSISEKVGCSSETLRRWVREVERETGVRADSKSAERAKSSGDRLYGTETDSPSRARPWEHPHCPTGPRSRSCSVRTRSRSSSNRGPSRSPSRIQSC